VFSGFKRVRPVALVEVLVMRMIGCPIDLDISPGWVILIRVLSRSIFSKDHVSAFPDIWLIFFSIILMSIFRDPGQEQKI
jgi:hypothetical protein